MCVCARARCWDDNLMSSLSVYIFTTSSFLGEFFNPLAGRFSKFLQKNFIPPAVHIFSSFYHPPNLMCPSLTVIFSHLTFILGSVHPALSIRWSVRPLVSWSVSPSDTISCLGVFAVFGITAPDQIPLKRISSDQEICFCYRWNHLIANKGNE